ncbi:hypothetical protein [Micromonospora endophytica]|uniref:Uncharacterized protein n=1 Tax=Micromonospora endophytica TaxID=515350 RepID=A0A2W2CLZ3_9ACTN|nr:hypothetical protein [Micromonospora endophytica]PZF99552.1 hypothetical protein C1I93_05635 [Micromonospora endophytica]RIW46805.1 hypothetical protein D3H59_11050 [Micromonospora endophytica]BCJ59188.1 hypothetical protein Jiend_26100 [Micromonospora endophytica]
MQPRPPRVFAADDILSGRVSLDAYPFRYIYVTPSLSSVFAGRFNYRLKTGNNGPPDEMLTAVELLETRGWEVVTVDASGHVTVMRRVMHR